MIFSPQKRLFPFSKLVELLFFPSFCKICSALLEVPSEKVVCCTCWEKIKAHIPSLCLCCGRFFGGINESHFCSRCLKEMPPFSVHRSCGRYLGTLKDIILLYKYGRFRILGKELAYFAHHTLMEEVDLWWEIEAVIPVPLHPRRKRKRGFNQAQIIAEEIAKLKKIKCESGLLKKAKNVLPQTLIEAREREKNVKGAFYVKKGNELEGKKVLLIDDVYTTGATLVECSRVLKEAGVEEVRAMTLAQA